MSVSTYQTADLIGVQRRIPQPVNFWRSKFTRVYTSTAEKIMFDELGEEDRRLAPFVAPLRQGRVMRELGYTTKSFKPAYLKPKHILRPDMVLTRSAGEAIGGSLSPAQRRDARVAEIMRMQRAMIERREDWMAFQAIAFGAVTVEGDDYPTQVVDFARDASLTYTLAGNFRWDVSGALGSTADVLGDIKTARTNAYNLGSVPVNTLVFGANAFARFCEDTTVTDLLKRDVRNGSSDFRAATLNAGEPWAYEGTIRGGGGGQGGFDLWTFQGTYRDDAGAATALMNTNDVVGIGDFDGVRAYGAILDLDSLEAVEMFPKMWPEKDPSAEFLMTQSAPLLVPMRPNATFRIRVA